MWTKNDLELALNRTLNCNALYNSVAIDSRAVKENDIFIGLKGAHYDGSNFARQAIDNGASLCITHFIPDDCKKFENQFYVVENTYDVLLALAKYNRDKKYSNATFVGVTGSVGKTTTKEMLKLVFQHVIGNTYANFGNLNNEFGLPLSLTNIDKTHLLCGIFELGMSQAGEIHNLSNILQPQIGVITGIAPAHMEFFKSLKEIATAKAEIVDGMSADSYLVVNCDAPEIETILSLCTNVKVIGYSTKDIAYDIFCKVIIRDTRVVRDDDESIYTGISLIYTIDNSIESEVHYRVHGIGNDLIYNSAATLSSLLAYFLQHSMNLNSIDQHMIALNNFDGLSGRGKVVHIPFLNIELIDESYNANPTSLSAALHRMNQYSIHTSYKRKIAILGDMLELGQDEIQMHKNIVNDILQNKIDKVFCVGLRMKELFDTLPKKIQGFWCETSDEIAMKILSKLKPYDVVMVKGSNSMKMSKVCEILLKYS